MFFNFFENIFKKQVSEEELYSCAQKAFENKEYEQTLEFLNEVIKIHPAAKYFAFIGNVYYNQNKYNSAVNAYIQAVNTNRYCDEYYEKLASIYHECERDDVALEYIQKALKYNPNEINYKILLADILNSMGNITDAKIIYKDLLNCLGNNDDKYCEILNKLEKLNEIQTQEYSEQYEKSAKKYYDEGQTYFNEKKYEDAIRCFKKAINLEPKNDRYHYWCGYAKYYNNQDKEAIKDFNNAIEINPIPKYYYFRGHAKYFIGKYNEAIEDYKIGICKNPENLYDYYELIADAKKGLGDIVGAIEVCKYILGNDSNEENKIKIQEKITELEQLQSQNNDASQEDFEESEQEIEDEDQYEKSAEDYYKEGRAYIEEEKYEEAVKCLEETIKLEPEDADNYYWCALAKYSNGQNKEALKDLASGIKLLPEDICYYYNLRGDINKDLGKYEDARKNYLKAINEADEDFDVDEVEETLTEIDEIQAQEFFEKGKKYFDKDKYEEAIEYFGKSKNLVPSNDNYIYWCGETKYWNNQDEEAIKDFDNAIELNPIPKYYYRRGHSKYFIGKYKEAIEDYNIGINKKPEDFYNYYELMADAKKELGDITGAIENYTYALENNPDANECEKIKEKIAELREVQSNDQVIDTKTTNKKEIVETKNQKIQEAEYYYQKGKKQYENKKTLSAKNSFMQAINYNNLNSEYYYWFVLASTQLNHFGDEQFEYIQKAIELDNTKAEYYYLFSKINFKQGNLERAFEEINKAVELDSNNSEYYILKADINKKLGNDEESYKDYEYAEELNRAEYEKCEQSDIYEAPPDKSFLVNAGPGTGKTYTLIQKIKYLLDPKNNIKEENILVLSHTNAAVDEIKNRLKNISEDTDIKVHRINIRTICSFVKYAHSKIDEFINKDKVDKDKKYYTYRPTENGFIEANKKLLNRLQFKSYNFRTLLEQLEIKYFIVDEIQDAVDTVGKIILKLTEACIDAGIPFALFGDECQAIFDFDKDNISKTEKMSSVDFYKNIKSLLSENNNTFLVSLDKNMRQQESLDAYKESLEKLREHILKNKIEECENDLNNIKNKTPDNLSTGISNIPENATHCILTHSNNRALYIASKLRKEGIPTYVRIKENEIQFEYHEWIGKILNKDEYSDINCNKFIELVHERNVVLPTNYKGYEETSHAKTFYEYINTKILDKEPNYKINKEKLLEKIYTEWKCDNIFKNSDKHDIEVSTIHKAKGREFDFVHIESECCEFKKEKKDMLNTYKNMYVALTRPKNHIDFVKFKFPNSFRKDSFYEVSKILKKITKYKILYNNIDLNSFNSIDYQKNILDVKINDEVILKNQGNGIWDIECKGKILGQMNKMDNEFRFGQYEKTNISRKEVNKNYRKNEMQKITGLRIDGIWSVFGRNNENGNIEVWNVVSFCGFGDVKYE